MGVQSEKVLIPECGWPSPLLLPLHSTGGGEGQLFWSVVHLAASLLVLLVGFEFWILLPQPPGISDVLP